MKTITVPARYRSLNDLLKKARRNGLILQSADGQRSYRAWYMDYAKPVTKALEPNLSTVQNA
ncbi:MAG: hypothetical protein HY000_15745 [Planctomycetes bacterium]|nr:hypothetical protein [Planctomycetota bacterium]